MIPDMVMVSRSEISDIFEMKFMPAWNDASIGEIERDIRKLLTYEGQQPARLDPRYGTVGTATTDSSRLPTAFRHCCRSERADSTAS